MKKALLIGIVLICLIGRGEGAASTGEGAASAERQPWTIDRFQRRFCGEDHWEPFNRFMFGIFDIGMEYVVDPFCYVYSSVIPKPLIKGIDNFSENLEYPKRLVSNLCIGEWLISWDETRRFLINSTLGIGGLFDPSREWFYIFDSDASLSDVATHWGVPSGPPLALPFMPRASLTGHITYVADYALDAKTYFDFICPSGIFLGYSWCLTPNKAPVWRGAWESLSYHTEDAYSVYMPLAAGMNQFNLRQFAWHYYENTFNRSYDRMLAKELPEGSPEREKKFAEAETKFNDVKPPVHAPTPKPANLKGRWRTIPGYDPRSPALDSLRALAFAPLGDDDFWWERRSVFCRDFSKSIDERDIEIAPDLPKATYSFIAAPADAASSPRPTEKLVLVMPGIGTGRTGNDTVAMAEILHHAGYAVVMIDSLFHWEYVRSANRGILPGNLVEDRRRLADYFARILDDLRADGLVTSPEISILGWSMGGMSTLHLANLADRGELPFGVRRFVAVNPPTSMEHALQPFDAVLERSCYWTERDVHTMFVRAAPSLYGWAAQDHPRYDPDNRPVDTINDPWNYAPNLTDEQAQYILALALNNVFPTLIEQRHRTHPFPWIKSDLSWFSRRDFRREIGFVQMREYVRRYVPACYEGITGEEMIAMADLRNLDSTLRGNSRLRVIHTRTDPLQTPEDRDYLDDALGDRITWFDEGAHCGYYYTTPYRDELLDRLSDRVASFPGEAGAQTGWKYVASEEGKVVYIPFEGYYESKGGRIETPRFPLDKAEGENAYYRLTFTAKSEVNGYWWVDLYDRDGKMLSDVNSRLYATTDWKDYDVMVPACPAAAEAVIAFVSKKGAYVKDVAMRRVSLDEAVAWCDALYRTLPQYDTSVPADAWEKLPRSRAAIRAGEEVRIVLLGDSIMNDSYCGLLSALAQKELPEAKLRFEISVRGSTGCWYYRAKENFDRYVAAYRPNLVLIGGISNYVPRETKTLREAEDAMVETIRRCQALGAEVVVCTPPPSYEFRKDAAARPFDRALLDEAVAEKYFQQAYERRAAARTGVPVWDLTTGPADAIARSGKPLDWFKRDAAHNDDRGKQLIAQKFRAYFRAAR